MILEYGLMRLGGTVLTSRYDPYDIQVQIRRYSGTDAVVSIHDSAGNELDMDIMHHEEAVAKAVGMLASQK